MLSQLQIWFSSMLVGNQHIKAAHKFCITIQTIDGYNLCCKYHCCTHGHNKGFGKIVTFTPWLAARTWKLVTSVPAAAGTNFFSIVVLKKLNSFKFFSTQSKNFLLFYASGYHAASKFNLDHVWSCGNICTSVGKKIGFGKH